MASYVLYEWLVENSWFFSTIALILLSSRLFQYFLDKVQKFKNGNASQWWKNMKTISRCHQPSDFKCFNNILYHSVPVDSSNLASTINMHLCEVTKHIPAIDQLWLDDLRNKLSPLPSQYTVEIEKVHSLLCNIILSQINQLDQMVFLTKISKNWLTFWQLQ